MNWLSFILGWAACVAFIAACEVIPQIIARRRALAQQENERAASLTEMCPWNIMERE